MNWTKEKHFYLRVHLKKQQNRIKSMMLVKEKATIMHKRNTHITILKIYQRTNRKGNQWQETLSWLHRMRETIKFRAKEFY